MPFKSCPAQELIIRNFRTRHYTAVEANMVCTPHSKGHQLVRGSFRLICEGVHWQGCGSGRDWKGGLWELGWGIACWCLQCRQQVQVRFWGIMNVLSRIRGSSCFFIFILFILLTSWGPIIMFIHVASSRGCSKSSVHGFSKTSSNVDCGTAPCVIRLSLTTVSPTSPSSQSSVLYLQFVDFH